MRLEGSAASWRAPKRVVDGGRDLWARGSTAVLRVASATRIVLGEGEFAGGGELLDVGRGKGRR